MDLVYGLKKYRGKIAIKKHGSAEMSVFRWGLDQWQNHLPTLCCFLDQLATYFNRSLTPEYNLLQLHVP
ncbi:MAG TPA: hypothetical protein VEX63_04920 [Flavisolibacter sp.]|nr:hypothetical protein [Flavisolibacter sp.]